jgi:uncharacterized integral membrane protein
MRIKTMLIIFITVLLTVVLMQNNGRVNFEFLWATFAMSKLLMLTFVAATAFILGVLVGRPKKVKKPGGEYDEHDQERNGHATLSNEDKDYID